MHITFLFKPVFLPIAKYHKIIRRLINNLINIPISPSGKMMTCPGIYIPSKCFHIFYFIPCHEHKEIFLLLMFYNNGLASLALGYVSHHIIIFYNLSFYGLTFHDNNIWKIVDYLDHLSYYFLICFFLHSSSQTCLCPWIWLPKLFLNPHSCYFFHLSCCKSSVFKSSYFRSM